MSDELYGEASTQAEQGFTQMLDPAPALEPAKSGTVEELAKEREKELPESEPIVRSYVQVGGEHEGEPVPDNQTLDIERAVRDLTERRQQESAVAQWHDDATFAQEVDALRGVPQQPVQPEAQQAQTQEQPQPNLQPQPEDAGIDPEFARVLEQNPRLTEALVQEFQHTNAKIDAAERQYAEAASQNAQVAAQALFSAYPELAHVPANEIRGAIAVIAQKDPARAQSIVSHIQNVTALHAYAQQSQAALSQRQQVEFEQQFSEFAKVEDAKFDKLVPEITDPATREKFRTAAINTLHEVGISNDDLARLWSGQASISLRDHRAQLLLLKAARFDEAQRTAPQKLQARPIPPVQKPGVGRDRSIADDYEIQQLERQLDRTGDVKIAAKLLLAKRAAAGP